MHDLTNITTSSLLKLKEGDTVHYQDPAHHYQTIRELFWNDTKLYIELDNDKIFGFNW